MAFVCKYTVTIIEISEDRVKRQKRKTDEKEKDFESTAFLQQLCNAGKHMWLFFDSLRFRGCSVSKV